MTAPTEHLADHPVSANTYERHGCKCAGCRAAHADRVRRNRADRLAAGRLTHGTRSAYDAGCRCTDNDRVPSCTGARRVAYEREATP